MKFTIERNWIDVVGHIWQPGIGLCAMTYSLNKHDMDTIGEPTRENVSAWIDTHSGDFQDIVDFRAVVGEVEIPWATEEGEAAFFAARGEE
jgi:hypothetical protein